MRRAVGLFKTQRRQLSRFADSPLDRDQAAASPGASPPSVQSGAHQSEKDQFTLQECGPHVILSGEDIRSWSVDDKADKAGHTMKSLAPSAFHESLVRNDDVQIGSDRNFGFVAAALCALVAGLQAWHAKPAFWLWLGAALIFAALAIIIPRALRPANIAWFKFGILLHHIVTPIVLTAMFYAIFTPMGWLMRLAGKRPLQLGFDPDAQTYWVIRDRSAPPASSFRNQF